MTRFAINTESFALTRCILCNALPERTEIIPANVPPKVSAQAQEFWQCPACHRGYWRGSQVQNSRERLKHWLLGCWDFGRCPDTPNTDYTRARRVVAAIRKVCPAFAAAASAERARSVLSLKCGGSATMRTTDCSARALPANSRDSSLLRAAIILECGHENHFRPAVVRLRQSASQRRRHTDGRASRTG